MKTYYEVSIDETGRGFLKDKPILFNRFREKFATQEEVRQFMANRYGKIPNGKNRIYVDDKNNNAVCVGFMHSFWNQDYSHNSKKWFQTDWIVISEVNENRLPFFLK